MPEPQWSPYEYPQLDVKEYNKKLEALLWMRFRAGQLEVEGRRLKPQNEKHGEIAEVYIEHLVNQTVLEGVNPRLPFYNEVITATMTPEWYGEQVGRYQQDWARWGEEQSQERQREWQREFGVQQWQQAEAWRRYGAETQQQQREREWEWREEGARREETLRRQGLMAERQQFASLRYAGALRGGMGGGSEEAQRRSQETLWQNWQNRLISEATWPQSEVLRMQENPFAQEDKSPFDYAQELKGEWEYAKERADYYRKRMKDPDDPLTSEGVSPEGEAARGWIEREARLGEMYEKEMETPEVQMAFREKARRERGREVAEKAGWGGDWGGKAMPRKPRYTTPATPAFLREAYPELGERLPTDKAQAPMHPLSGQQWGRMLPSQRQKWAGYISWAGGKPEDVYAQMEQMRPRYKPGVAWRPARQM